MKFFWMLIILLLSSGGILFSGRANLSEVELWLNQMNALPIEEMDDELGRINSELRKGYLESLGRNPQLTAEDQFRLRADFIELNRELVLYERMLRGILKRRLHQKEDGLASDNYSDDLSAQTEDLEEELEVLRRMADQEAVRQNKEGEKE